MKNSIKKSLTLLIALVLMLTSIPITAMAATETAPYGYTWEDSSSGKTIYQFYEYDNKHDTFSVTKRVSAKGNYIYSAAGDLIFSSSKGNSSKYIGFDEDGTLIIIAQDGSVYASENLKVFQQVLKKCNASSLNFNLDDLVTSVKTQKGTVSVSNFQLQVEVLDENKFPEQEVVVKKAKNRVDQTENSAGEMVFKAYKDGKHYMTLIVGKNKVLNETAEVRLSDTLKGAKFLGIDTNYNVYMYETNGSLYRFKYGEWYSAQKIALSGTFKSCSRDDNGFLSKVVTTNATYAIDQLTTDSKWIAKQTYAVNKDTYATLYIKNSAKSHTLSIDDDDVLYLDGTYITKNVDEFYFVNKSSFVYIKGTKLYKASISDPSTATRITSKFEEAHLTNGLIKKVTLTTGASLNLS